MKTKFERQRSHRAQFAPQSATIFKQFVPPHPPSLTTCQCHPKRSLSLVTSLDKLPLLLVRFFAQFPRYLRSPPELSVVSFSSAAFRFLSWIWFLFPSLLVSAKRFYQRFTSLSQVISEKKVSLVRVSHKFFFLLLVAGHCSPSILVAGQWSLVSPTYLCLPYNWALFPHSAWVSSKQAWELKVSRSCDAVTHLLIGWENCYRGENREKFVAEYPSNPTPIASQCNLTALYELLQLDHGLHSKILVPLNPKWRMLWAGNASLWHWPALCFALRGGRLLGRG